MIYLGICSVIGSLTVSPSSRVLKSRWLVSSTMIQDPGPFGVLIPIQVMSIKAVGIAIKLTVEGVNQAGYFQTWVFFMIAITCIVIQLNYLNMVSTPPASLFTALFFRDLLVRVSFIHRYNFIFPKMKSF